MTKPHLCELPAGIQLVYLAEGGANVIYRFVSPASAPVNSALAVNRSLSTAGIETCSNVPAQLGGKLLRLRKETAADIPYQETVRNFDNIIRPLFNPEELVDQTLIRLPEGLIQRCNEQLRLAEINGLRPSKRHGGYLCLNEPFGLLITDMTTADEPGASMAELKPKWLTQSPSAPSTARRCRTCALREMKDSNAWNLQQTDHQRSFCPLDLVSERFENVFRATAFIKGCGDRTQLARVLYRNTTLQKLQSHQKAMKNVGLHGPLAQSPEMSVAMTLRDCTMYIKIPSDDRAPVEIRLGDLDVKAGSGGKAEYWLDVETQLISEGWYRGANSSQERSDCALQSSRRSTPST
ncbi:Inositol-pentakisphosphate 2-kinase [Penicillium lagena]|uniref:Inositol-pentakisphosphate 2-kinase n=1 Tax=Penicillium lagena TaxID=94218 RepID=UPI002541434C|nr:Inositol-pentakisphosphate 2-kinase [Penicillium lagena]KAJ5619767.1 Inositol-pentakisphosphate 2-kinase [Penicillium lagena]